MPSPQLHVHRIAPAILYAVKVHQGICKTPATIPFNCLKPSKKSGEQNNYAAAALEKIVEVLLPLRVDPELVQCRPATPAAHGVADAIPERGRSCYEDEEQRDAIRPSAASRAPAMQSLSRRGDPHALRHHCRECRAVAVALQQRLHSRKGAFEPPHRRALLMVRCTG